MKSSVLLVLFAGIAAVSSEHTRIVGGGLTTVNVHPYAAVLLRSFDYSNYEQACGGTILNIRSILTAAQCLLYTYAPNWRVRVGSSFASTGGFEYNVNQLLQHPNYDPSTLEYDFAIYRLSSNLVYSLTIARAAIAGPYYNVPDAAAVTAIGWGQTENYGQPSEQLRQAEIWTVNQAVCEVSYEAGRVKPSMMCAGYLNTGGRGQCLQDLGSPLIHQKVIVGVFSWSAECGDPYKPGVSARVSSASLWIQANV